MIWEERQVSKYGRKETDRPYQYFQMYLQQEGRRSVKRLHEAIKNSQKNSQKNLQRNTPKLETLQHYCLDYNWVARAKAYDQHQHELRLQTQEENNLIASTKVSEFRANEVDIATARAKYSTKVLDDAYKKYLNGELSIDEFVKILEVLSKIYGVDIDCIDRLDTVKDKVDKGTVINNMNGDNNQMMNKPTFHELMNKTDLLEELTDDEYNRDKRTNRDSS